MYWTRIDPQELERVEVLRGSSTSVFGDRAMSGAIALFSRPAEQDRISLGYEGGNLNSHMVSAGYSQLWRQFGGSFSGRAFTTDGYFTVPAGARGPVDRPANVQFVTGNLKLDWLGALDRLSVKLDILAEGRENGTVLTENSTGLGNVSANYAHEWKRDTLSVLAFHTREQYHSTFSSITNNRKTERITYWQTVPSTATGGAGLWRHSGSGWNVVAGADAQRVEGTSTDKLVPSGLRAGGGSQLQHGIFGQTDFSLGPVKLFAGARHQFAGQDTTFFSPSGGFSIGSRLWRARGSVYRAFRAPTLNELFREFRVGNAATLANPRLTPEKVFGAEAGVDLVGERTRASFTLYRHDLTDVITNVTLSSTPTLITRQRQNAAAALALGVEFNLRRDIGPLQAEVGYLFAESRFANGLRIPQVPKHQGSAQLTYARKGTLISAGVRSFGMQFEDDLNIFRLGGYATVQMSIRQQLRGALSASLNFENLLDREYLVGFSPTPLIGAPRLWRAGLRWH